MVPNESSDGTMVPNESSDGTMVPNGSSDGTMVPNGSSDGTMVPSYGMTPRGPRQIGLKCDNLCHSSKLKQIREVGDLRESSILVREIRRQFLESLLSATSL